MDRKKLLGAAHPDSPVGKKILEAQTAAESAREKMDVEALYSAYEKAIEQRAEMEEVLLGAVGIWAGKGDALPNDMHAVKAMRDVALAAIELAKEVSKQADA